MPGVPLPTDPPPPPPPDATRIAAQMKDAHDVQAAMAAIMALYQAGVV